MSKQRPSPTRRATSTVSDFGRPPVFKTKQPTFLTEKQREMRRAARAIR